MKDSVLKIGGEEYDVIPTPAVLASKMLVDFHRRQGSPDTPLSDQGERVMNTIISIWMDLYPKDYYEWLQVRDQYKKNELSISEQVREQTGRSLASIPTPVYRMMRKVFPEFKMSGREEMLKLVRKFSIFQMCNKV